MPKGTKQKLYEKAWHAEKPYDRKEIIRLVKACELIRRHCEDLWAGRRYDLLDVGCGVGPMREWLPAERFNITGLEISETAAAAARENYDACEVADVEATWPVEPAGFDGIHAGAILEHVADWHAPLNHANTALRDGGLLVVAVPNLRYWKEIRRLIRGRQPHWLTDVQHLHGYTPKFLTTLVSLHGFEVFSLEADRVNLPLLPNRSRWVTRRFAGIGSVLILAGRLTRRVRVEDDSRADEFPNHKPVALRSIEIMPR
jgi:SAM-dependent methyltransferase